MRTRFLFITYPFLLQPQFGQKFVVIPVFPHSGQAQVASGRFAPQFGQKFVRMLEVPHFSQSQPGELSGCFFPQFGQNREAMLCVPQSGQFQVSVAAAPAALPVCAPRSKTGWSASRVMFTTLPIAPSVTPRLAISPSPPFAPSPPVIPFFIASRPTCRAVSC